MFQSNENNLRQMKNCWLQLFYTKKFLRQKKKKFTTPRPEKSRARDNPGVKCLLQKMYGKIFQTKKICGQLLAYKLRVFNIFFQNYICGIFRYTII